MKKIHWPGVLVAAAALQWCYLSTRRAGFVTDFTGLAERIETHGAGGLPASFGFPALQPVTSALYYVFYRYFSIGGWGWHLSATLLHTASALLLFLLVRRLLEATHARPADTVAALGALLFLFSPYASEVVVWRVAFNYLLVTLLMLATLWNAQRWLEQGRRRAWWWALGCQTAALLTFELAVVTPVLCLALLLWQRRGQGRRQAFARLFLPHLALVGLYFLANRLILGAWIGHYGSAVHLHFPVSEMIANVGRYAVKWIAFSRYWPHPWKEGLAQALAHPAGLILLVTLGAGLAIRLLARFRRMSPAQQFAWVFAGAAIVALAPVLNLYFNYLLHIENDRYGYLAAAFFYPACMAWLSRLPRPLFLGIAALYLLASVWLLQRTNGYWADSATVYHSLLADFDAYDQDTIYLLNLPDNLQGAPMFRDYSGQDRAFADALRYVQRRPYRGAVHEVAQYNMVFPTDGVSVEPDSTGLKVTFNQWGNWWWRRGIGAASYTKVELVRAGQTNSTTAYTDPDRSGLNSQTTSRQVYRDSIYSFLNEGHHYRLEWRQRPKRAAILYQVGKEWQAFEGLEF